MSRCPPHSVLFLKNYKKIAFDKEAQIPRFFQKSQKKNCEKVVPGGPPRKSAAPVFFPSPRDGVPENAVFRHFFGIFGIFRDFRDFPDFRGIPGFLGGPRKFRDPGSPQIFRKSQKLPKKHQKKPKKILLD